MIALRTPTLEEMNRVCMAAVLCGGGLIGSGVSFIVAIGLLFNPLHLIVGTYDLPRDRNLRLIAAAFAFFYLANGLSGLVNFTGPESLLVFVENLPFLAFPLIYGLASISPRRAMRDAVVFAAIGASIAGFLFAAIQTVVLGMPRAEGMAGNPGPFAVVCAVLYCLCALASVDSRGPLRIVALVATAGAAGALLLSGMRGVWPILVIAPVILALLHAPRLRAAMPGLRTAGYGAVVFALLALLTYDFVATRIEALTRDYEQIVEKGDYNNSLGQRLVVWQVGIDLVRESPVFGHGSAGMRALMAERTASHGVPGLWFSHFHNFLLDAWVRAGAIGAAAILAMLVTPLWLAHRQRNRDAVARFGYALMLLVTASVVTSGSVGIMFGHDIIESLYLFGIVISALLVFGGIELRPPADPVAGAA